MRALRGLVVDAEPRMNPDCASAFELLRQADPKACQDLVPTFLAWLRSDDAYTRSSAVRSLQALRSRARGAIPALKSHLDRGQPWERFRVAAAILAIDSGADDEAKATIRALLDDPGMRPQDRDEALTLIGRESMGMGP